MKCVAHYICQSGLTLFALIFSTLSFGEAFVIQGEKLTDDRVNFMARIIRIDPTSGSVYSVCSGSLIDENYVLTAAHCFNGNNDDLFVVLGITRTNQIYQEILEIKSIFINEGYNSDSLYHDIALINIDQSDKDYLTPLALSDNEQDYRTEYSNASSEGRIYVNGYGSVDPFTHASNSFLHTAKVDLITQDACENFRANVHATQLCSQFVSGSNGKFGAPCYGDSGGPLYYQAETGDAKYVQIGVISYGSKSCSTLSGDNPTSVYTEVVDYQDWIQSVIKGNYQPSEPVNASPNDTDVSFSPDGGSGGSLAWWIAILLVLVSGARRVVEYQRKDFAMASR